MTEKKPPRNPRRLQKKVHVKTRHKRSVSSARWLERQLNDPYVAEAKAQGFHSRAAFKIQQMHKELGLFRRGMKVVDLGAAPGGWTQVACEIVEPGASGGKVVAIDYLDMKPVAEATFIKMDFMDNAAPEKLKEAIGGSAHVVLSDMAPPTTGHRETDHLRIMALAEAAYDFAKEVLLPGGAFVCKVFQGGSSRDLLNRLKKDFARVKHVKPPASRQDSSEMYVVGLGFRG